MRGVQPATERCRRLGPLVIRVAVGCAIARTMAVLGERWTFVILRSAFTGAMNSPPASTGNTSQYTDGAKFVRAVVEACLGDRRTDSLTGDPGRGRRACPVPERRAVPPHGEAARGGTRSLEGVRR